MIHNSGERPWVAFSDLNSVLTYAFNLYENEVVELGLDGHDLCSHLSGNGYCIG